MIEKSKNSAVVAVCIPTRGREKWLRRLLYSIERQNFDKEVIVVVSDNDVINRVGTKVVEELRQEGYRWDIQAVFAPKPCMSCSWNTVFNYASNLDVEYLATIDDDEVATEFWLHLLLQALKQLDVDVIVGSLIQRKKNNAPFAKHYYEMVAYKNFNNMQKDTSNRIYSQSLGSGNFLIKRDVMAKFLPNPTSEKYDDFGGGDTDMFMKIMNSGYKSGFSEEALCWEEVSEERESLRQCINFIISVGQRNAAFDINNFSLIRMIISTILLSVKAVIFVAIFLYYYLFRFEINFNIVRKLIVILSYFSYLVGFRSKFYIKDSHIKQ